MKGFFIVPTVRMRASLISGSVSRTAARRPPHSCFKGAQHKSLTMLRLHSFPPHWASQFHVVRTRCLGVTERHLCYSTLCKELTLSATKKTALEVGKGGSSSDVGNGTRKDPNFSRKQCFNDRGAAHEVTHRTMQIRSLCQQGLIEEAYRVFKEMKAMDMVATGEVLYSLVVGLALIGHLEDAYKVSIELKGMGKKTVYGALMSGLSRSGHVEHLERCCKESQAAGLKVSMKAFKAMINALVKCGLSRKAYDIYLMLKAKGRHPDSFILDSLIFAWSEGGEVDVAYSLLQELRSRSGALRPELFNAVMKGYALEKRFDDVLKVIQDMENDHVQCDLVTYNTLIDMHGKNGTLADALRLYRDMSQKGIAPDVFTFTTLIDVLGRANLADEAYQLYKDMKGLGVRPNVITYNTLFKVLGKSGHIQAASLIVEEMAEQGVSPDAFTFSSLIDSLGRASRFHAARSLFERIKTKTGIVDVVTYTALIRALNKAGYVDASLAYFKEMQASGYPPNLVAYSTLIDGLAKSGRLDEGYLYFKEMESCGCYPNAIIYNTLIHNFAKAGRRDFVKQLMADMEAKGMHPDPYTYGGLIDGYGKSGNIQEAQKIFKDLKQRGGTCLNVAVCNSMLTALIRETLIDEALELFYEMPEFDISPNEQTYKLICSPVRFAGRFRDLERITELQNMAYKP